jgi:hypothetical protein
VVRREVLDSQELAPALRNGLPRFLERALVLDHARVTGGVGEVGVEATVGLESGVEGDREEPLLAAVAGDLVADVEKRCLLAPLVGQAHDPPAALDDVEVIRVRLRLSDVNGLFEGADLLQRDAAVAIADLDTPARSLG